MLLFHIHHYLSTRTLLRLYTVTGDVSLKQRAVRRIGHPLWSLESLYGEQLVIVGKTCVIWWYPDGCIRAFMINHRDVSMEGFIDHQHKHLLIRKVSVGDVAYFKKMIGVLRRTFLELITNEWKITHASDLLIHIKVGQHCKLWLPAYIHLTLFDSNPMNYIEFDTINEGRACNAEHKVR